MSADPTPNASLEIAQADRLYKSFPNFSDWGDLSPSDVDLWDRFAANLNDRRQSATPEALKSAVEVAVRAAALDTGAIEGLYDVDRGFTMTVALQSLAWEQAIEERGAGVRELFEAQLAAYELVLDAVTRKLPVTEAWIRALHEKLCAPQKTYRVLTDLGWQEQELPKGQYKTRPNHVRLTDGTFHAYAPVDRVTEEMHRLLEQIRTPEFEAAHPVLQASYCHYALVVIHPFADGNGRAARALASIFFYRAESTPLVIFENQRLSYLECLRAADLGDSKPVISFFQDRGLDTMQLVAESLMTAEMPKPADLARRARTRAAKRKGERPDVSLKEAEALGNRLFDEVNKQFTAQASELDLDMHLSALTYGSTLIDFPIFFRFRARRLRGGTFKLKALRLGSASTVVSILFSPSANRRFRFAIQARGARDILEIRLEDVYPELSEPVKLRIAQWVQRRISAMLLNFERKHGKAK